MVARPIRPLLFLLLATAVEVTGILRESFVVEGSQIVSTPATEYCVDTVNDVDSCLYPDDEMTESFSVDGNTLSYDGDTLSRIPAP